MKFGYLESRALFNLINNLERVVIRVRPKPQDSVVHVMRF